MMSYQCQMAHHRTIDVGMVASKPRGDPIEGGEPWRDQLLGVDESRINELDIQ